MSLKIHNTLTGKIEELVPINPPKVLIYTCGVTVYDDSHVGHGRSLVVFDTFRRFLEHLGYNVYFVRNFTDVDDKIINRAKEECTDFMTIANRYIASYYRDMEAIRVKPADVEPRVTEHMKEIIEVIQKLIDRGFAYESGGDVYFSVRSFKNYGKLSKRSPEEMEAGARVEPSEKKRDPLDFALWKAAKAGEPAWDSPWGKGRPGWHTECVAMVFKHLGETIDIHGGGLDLVFPHHENEMAQAEAITGKPFARYWMHNGLVTVGGQKMSKSLGNYVTLREIYRRYHPDILRLLVLFTHYRSPLDFSWEKMEETQRAYERLKGAIEDYEVLSKLNVVPGEGGTHPLYDKVKEVEEAFFSSLSDDFNTPEAISHMFALVNELGKVKNRAYSEGKISEGELGAYEYASKFLLNTMKKIFGLLEDLYPECEVKRVVERELEAGEVLDQKLVELLIEVRTLARQERQFKIADFVRDKLKELGIELEDTPAGTKWKRR
ncbi:cysteinyl-tRNA synthetase [Hydrogenivirga caldilitoris]|uniref:Cysteine--tRNA ligase n=1 Tax=Hydrogenivirga caldilitoris TaxID=246264 RepID=A0A497XSE4_9AQUI|nr:cysteine--tRNA ligase [Hydrogenivirga caldilitoris]RLJ69843.1 cysteinyl-tRNA synthetase [Hydrogenivirga caldilitoris]